jgi:hypothetical protein
MTSTHICIFMIISPWTRTFIKNFFLFSSPKDNLYQVWLKRRFLNDPYTPFLHFCDYLPFEQEDFCQHKHMYIWFSLL